MKKRENGAYLRRRSDQQKSGPRRLKQRQASLGQFGSDGDFGVGSQQESGFSWGIEGYYALCNRN
jgi:hypothetical protein